MPGSLPPRAPVSLQRRLTAALTERLLLKATALFLAVVLWLVVNAKEPQVELVTVRFAPELLDSSLVLRDGLPQLQAIVAGAPRDLIRLTSNPPVIRRRVNADAPDTLVVDLRPEDVTLPDGVDAVVRDVQPRSLTLRFESTSTRRVAVAPTGIQITRATPGTDSVYPQFDPRTVQITGPRRLILQIRSVRTVLTTIAYPDSLAHLVDIDTTTLGAGIRVRPEQVRVHLAAEPRA